MSDTNGCDCDVLVVGAGPVGLTLAMDLASRGVSVRVLEARPADAPAHPKCNTTSARSMEIFRRLGVAAEVRRAGLPADHPCDVAYATRFLGHELGRFPFPAWSRRYDDADGSLDGTWPTPEPPHRISQLYLEPVLRRHAMDTLSIAVDFDAEVTALTDRGAGVEALVRHPATGSERRLRARFAVGCDGARSLVRKAIGAKLHGDDNLSRTRSVYLRSHDLKARQPRAAAWMTWIINDERRGNVIALDGESLWLCHCTLRREEAFDATDTRAMIAQVIGAPVDVEILAAEDWTGRRLVADRYRAGNMFLAGDAAHLWIPYGGFGMNAGIEDAISLGWMLAATLKGWGSSALLDAYEAERQPIGEQVSRAAQRLFAEQGRVRLPAALEDDGPDGDGARRAYGAALLATDKAQFNPVGLNFAIAYGGSPVIAYDDGIAPAFEIDRYEPSTTPGCRAPQARLRDGAWLHDLLGPDFTLVTHGRTPLSTAFQAAATRQGLPLAVVDISAEPQAAALYDHPLVLVRPDQRVAWRGHAPPAAIDALLERVRGARQQEARS
ncbi:FAD-dependent oxidoreductase [Vineibacter terrae]|uniref:FAD-dependent oxidoreductase n=1 Tax=Vineibacter terrae TaxID=2586908 RepID=A0A5C8PL54_9HYPH|nr:FAD-dependent oxidoreductase [Vineibacter terrae]TXL74661.1 FAD-dependent oxidoreductase [Vineibacter terrae]